MDNLSTVTGGFNPVKYKELTKEQLIADITREMIPFLNNAQILKLQEILGHCFWKVKVEKDESVKTREDLRPNEEYLDLFITAKTIEGCSEKTLHYYRATLRKLFELREEQVTHMTTEDLRDYLSDYQKINNCSKSNIDNIRRILSTFFAWLEDENYILKSPVRRIHKIRTAKTVKETYTDESLELLRDNTDNLRDLALIDILASTGMRVGELVRLNIEDIDFENRECIVFGKGSKERPVYFDARTKIHLKNYIESRSDSNPALFVSLLEPHNRLEISGVEIRLRQLGKKLGINKVHPHKFRRTLATRAIDKGVPVEQVQTLLGHAKIDTTMQYAMVNQNNVKNSYQKLIA